MTVDMSSLDAHEQPSEELRTKFKKYAKADLKDLFNSDEIDDLGSPDKAAGFIRAGEIKAETIAASARHLSNGAPSAEASSRLSSVQDAPIYYHPLLPGLLIIPSVIPPEIQKTLLRHMIHRDLSNPKHLTNLHPHYSLPYRDETAGTDISFFSYPPDSPDMFQPRDPKVHKPLSFKRAMERSLRWVTLGGQYDWTSREYPEQQPPEFPRDMAAFLGSLFPETVAQAAIVNFYTPGDTMSMHRDVSEETDKGLISISFGCDSLFMVAPNDAGKASEGEEKVDGGKQYLLLRLRSGDAVYMTKESRFAWHGVPRVLKGTCPEYLEDWPAEDGKYEEWRGWMKNKRVNLNVRQMRD